MRKGFTLIEFLIYIAVLVIIISAVISFFLWSNQINIKTTSSREVMDNINRAMAVMSYEIKSAEDIYFPTSVLGTNPGQLSLMVSNYLPSGETTSYVDFYLCGTQICLKKESPNSIIILTSDNVEVKKLIFSQIATDVDKPSIKIKLEIDYKAPSDRPEYRNSVSTSSVASPRSY